MLQSGGFIQKERCFKLPRSTGRKSDELWQSRSYSSRFAIATWKVGWDLTMRNETRKTPKLGRYRGVWKKAPTTGTAMATSMLAEHV